MGESSWHLASKKPIQIDLGGPRYFLEMDGFTGRPYGIYATDEPLLTGLFLKMPRKYPMLGCWDVLVTVSLVPANWGRLCLRTILDLKNMCILQLKTGVPAYQQERVR